MLLAALLGLTDNPKEWSDKISSLVPEGVRIAVEEGETCGLKGLRARVTASGHEEDGRRHHHHTTLKDIDGMINALHLPPKVKADAVAVYRLLAGAEAEAHGRTVDLVHFHEVGALDAVADIVGVCFLINILSPDRIVASPVYVGSGTVECAHGMMPVPAPATACLLRGIPVVGGKVSGELCTPTGAALLRHFAEKFIPLPAMTVEKTGIGLGAKDFSPYPNCLRLFLGEEGQGSNNAVAEICCNLDDMTGEEIGFAVDALFKAKALDVFTVPAQMKKNRPGVLLTVLCPAEDADRFAALMLKHTSTFGVRKRICERVVLERSIEKRETSYGSVAVKAGSGSGVYKEKIEYESAADLAVSHGVNIRDVAKSLEG
jgi:uncharacterized protein (TIGR00299 family) protein